MTTTTDSDLEILILNGEGPACEFRHGATLPCTDDVTHRVIACRQQGNVCAAAAELTRYRMENGATCSGCHQPAGDCWYLRPI
jgi:hypothetical protein